MAILPILEVPDPLLRASLDPGRNRRRRRLAAHRRHVRDDVRSARHRPRRDPGRGAQARRGDRPAGSRGRRRRAGEEAARLHQPGDRRPFGGAKGPTTKAACRSPTNMPRSSAPTVRARWIDEDGKSHEGKFDGLMSVCLQHEMDHLEGVLFIDHLSRLKRDMVVQEVVKSRRERHGPPGSPLRPGARAVQARLTAALRQSSAHSRQICAHNLQCSWSCFSHSAAQSSHIRAHSSSSSRRIG